MRLDEDLALADSLVGPRWEGLRGAHLLLTGATGFFGVWLLSTLLHAERAHDLGVRVTILSRDPARFRRAFPALDHLRWRWLPGDVRALAPTVDPPAGPYTHAILGATAASAALNAADPLEMFGVIVDGTRASLRALPAAERVLFVSSGAVYGPQPPDLLRVPETHRGGPDPLDPGSAYAVGKLAAEHLVTAWGRARGVPVVVARAFAFSGPHLPLDAHFALGNFVRDAVAGRDVVVMGDGTPFRSYLDAAELAAWLWVLLTSGAGGRAYNVGSGDAIDIRGLAELVARLGGVRADVRGVARPGVPAARYVPDVTRIADELGLTPRRSLEESVARMMAWAR